MVDFIEVLSDSKLSESDIEDDQDSINAPISSSYVTKDSDKNKSYTESKFSIDSSPSSSSYDCEEEKENHTVDKEEKEESIEDLISFFSKETREYESRIPQVVVGASTDLHVSSPIGDNDSHDSGPSSHQDTNRRKSADDNSSCNEYTGNDFKSENLYVAYAAKTSSRDSSSSSESSDRMYFPTDNRIMLDISSDESSFDSKSTSQDKNISPQHDMRRRDTDDGDVIQSKYGQRNIGIQEGVSFSSASSLFFSNIAKGEVVSSNKETNNGNKVTQPQNPYANKNKLQHTKQSFHPFPKESSNHERISMPKHQSNQLLNSVEPTKAERSSLPCQPKSDEPVKTYIDPSLYKPPSYKPKADPIVHYFNESIRPIATRRMTPVSSIYLSPVSLFWKSKFHSFNHLQSEIAQALAYSDDNIVVSAPTGAGKTCIFEMAMGRMFMSQINHGHQQSRDVPQISKSRKIVYISPSKALCEERFQDWKKRLSDIDSSIECVTVTGDSGSESFRRVASAHLILTTPEKWDSLTRKWTDHLYLIGSVKLLLLDEVHMLGDDCRGSCLEATLCRMKTVQRAAKGKSSELGGVIAPRPMNSVNELASDMRIVAVSATLPNIVDIASFLDAHEAYSFDESYRPVPLTTHVVGLGFIGKNHFLFDKGLNRHVPDILKQFSHGKPAIIFCHTKKQTEALAVDLSTSCGSRDNNVVLSNVANQTNLPPLQICLKRGIGYHHAGMEAENRKLVEDAFSNGLLKVLCATSTLAMGVNLPAHLVVIKGTSVWRGSGQGYQELDTGTLLQMIGRAGRPGFDTSGTAVIMTDAKSKQKYENMSSGIEVVESMIMNQLFETLNTEISQKVIANVENAIDWLKGTYFYRRVRKNPKFYRMLGKSEADMEIYLMKHTMNALEKLHESGIIIVENGGRHITPKVASHVMSQHMVPYEEMKLIMALSYNTDQEKLINVLSEMKGLQYPVRKSEKALLNNAHKEIKYKLEGPPSKIRIQTPQQKAFVLLQAAIGQCYLEDYTLRQEISQSVEYAARILTAVEDFNIKETKHGHVALESLLLRRCLATSLWGPSDGVLNQLRGVTHKTAAKLAMSNIRTFNDIVSKSSNEIEQACGRVSPFGQELKAAVSMILRSSLTLSAKLDGLDNDEQPNILTCTLSPRESANKFSKYGTDDTSLVKYTLAVHTDRPGSSLMFRADLSKAECHTIVCPKSFGRLYIRLVSNLVGLDEQLTIDGNDEIELNGFKLTPTKSKESKKMNLNTSSRVVNKRKLSDTRDQVIDNSFRNQVIDIDDFRVHKRVSNNAVKSVISTPASFANEQIERIQEQSRDVLPLKNKIVTPSPPPYTTPKSARYRQASHDLPSNLAKTKSPLSDMNTKSMQGEKINRLSTPNHKPSRSDTNLWDKQKNQQRILQRRAFGSPKENPFAGFKYDPNDVESQLEQESLKYDLNKSSYHDTRRLVTPSISHVTSNTSNFRRLDYSTFKSPTIKTVSVSRFGSMRRGKVSSASIRIQERDLLRQKAEEQQAYAQARTNMVMSNVDSSYQPNYDFSHQTLYRSEGSFAGKPIDPRYAPRIQLSRRNDYYRYGYESVPQNHFNIQERFDPKTASMIQHELSSHEEYDRYGYKSPTQNLLNREDHSLNAPDPYYDIDQTMVPYTPFDGNVDTGESLFCGNSNDTEYFVNPFNPVMSRRGSEQPHINSEIPKTGDYFDNQHLGIDEVNENDLFGRDYYNNHEVHNQNNALPPQNRVATRIDHNDEFESAFF